MGQDEGVTEEETFASTSHDTQDMPEGIMRSVNKAGEASS